MPSFRRAIIPITLIIAVVAGIFQAQLTHAEVIDTPILIGQVKITASNGQFIMLYNNSNEPVDMSAIQLVYYNNYDITKATTNKHINLSGKLAPKNYYMVSDDTLLVCYKMTVNAVSLGFSSTAGMVQVMMLSQAIPGGLVTTSLVDSFAWSKATVAGAQTLPSSSTNYLQRVWAENTAKAPGAGSWQTVQPDPDNACDLQVHIAASNTPVAETAPGATYPTRIVKLASETASGNNLGLIAPELTELFPNPAKPETDDADEFIELYNPNDQAFSLKGYRLEAGATYSRGYTFKEGSLLPKSYTAFKITETNLQLTNGEGQVRLLNPEGTTISETPGYVDAPAGSSWSLYEDSWGWTEQPTPNSINVNEVKSDNGLVTKKPSSKKPSGKVAGAATTTRQSPEELKDEAPLHPGVLAGVGFAAVAYAMYEYRKDMANRIFQLRQYLRNRRALRSRM